MAGMHQQPAVSSRLWLPCGTRLLRPVPRQYSQQSSSAFTMGADNPPRCDASCCGVGSVVPHRSVVCVHLSCELSVGGVQAKPVIKTYDPNYRPPLTPMQQRYAETRRTVTVASVAQPSVGAAAPAVAVTRTLSTEPQPCRSRSPRQQRSLPWLHRGEGRSPPQSIRPLPRRSLRLLRRRSTQRQLRQSAPRRRRL